MEFFEKITPLFSPHSSLHRLHPAIAPFAPTIYTTSGDENTRIPLVLQRQTIPMTQQAIRRGVLQSFNASTYTASVLIVEATNYVLSSVPIATSVDGTSAIAGASCAVLFFDESNHTDAVIIAIYGTAPSPTPGRVNFITPVILLNSVTITNGVTATYTVSGIPAGTLGILYRLTMNTSTAGAFVYAGPHGSTLSNYIELDNPGVAGAFANISGILPVDANGKIDLQANGGNCNVTLSVYGYVI